MKGIKHREKILLIISILIVVVLSVLIEINILKIQLGYYAIAFSIIMCLLLYKYSNLDIIQITSLITSFFMLMAFLAGYQAVKISEKTYESHLEANMPHLSIQITKDEWPYGNFHDFPYTEIISKNRLNESSIKIPMYLKIYNWGSINTMIYTIKYKSNCIDESHSHEIPLPKNKTTLIKPGEFYEANVDIELSKENKKIGDLLPCDFSVEVNGSNFEPETKKITLSAP